MLKAERADFIRKKLGKLYPRPPVPLTHHNPFTLLVAVILSAQCTDVRVNQVTPALFKRARTPQAMRRLTHKTIYDIIRPCGLAPQKTKALLALSEQLLQKHGGRVPGERAALEALPGVGRKTAGVVLNQAFGKPAFPVDTHIHRLARRWGLSSGRNVVQTERDLKRLFDERHWGALHLQMIYYGREHCTARGCDGTICEICRTCFPRRRRPMNKRK